MRTRLLHLISGNGHKMLINLIKLLPRRVGRVAGREVRDLRRFALIYADGKVLSVEWRNCIRENNTIRRACNA